MVLVALSAVLATVLAETAVEESIALTAKNRGENFINNSNLNEYKSKTSVQYNNSAKSNDNYYH